MPVEIHGKPYNTVAERLAMAKDDLIGVQTEVLAHSPVVIKATITVKKGTFTGISGANSQKTIEKESPYEVAETSAVGRALAFAGYETTGNIASAEEMRKAIAEAEKPKDSSWAGMDSEMKEKVELAGQNMVEVFNSTYGTEDVKCSQCGSPAFDNREKKASGTYKSTSPDFVCRNPNCKKAWGWGKK
jgi:hypothetical protein